MHSERSAENGWGWMTQEAWQTLHDLLLEGQIISEPLDLSAVWTNDYLPDSPSW
jgi:hypothetical protein